MSSDMRASTGATPVATPDADTTGELWVEGADWESVADAVQDDLLTVNMGPQHPSTHGVLRLLLQLDGETVEKLQPIIGYLHTGIEKNAEYRGWHQGVTFFTRMDYVANFYHEAAFCLAVERLLDIRVPERAEVARVIIMEFNRIASHLIWLATGGMELGATTVMTMGFGLREHILDLFESQSGLRMNNAYFRPGGLAHQLTDDFEARCEALLEMIPGKMRDFEDLLRRNPIFNDRLRGVGYIDAETCHAYGVTGPILRAAGVPWDLRKQQPYSGYERYDFDVPTSDLADSWGRFEVRVAEIQESMRIIRQALDQLPDGPVMVADKHIAWPSQQSVGVDGIGNDPEYIRHIMGESMEALINHFKLVTQGFPVPAGQVYQAVESPRGELGYAVTSAGTNKPYRVHVRDPSFVNLQAADVMSRGGSVSDVIVVVASLDPVMGGVDR